MPLTDKQADVLEFLKWHRDMYGYPPTLREIGSAFGWNSTNAASDMLKALVKKGAIEIFSAKSRAIRILGENQKGPDA